MSNKSTTEELLAKIQELEAKIRYGLVWEEKEPEEVEVLCNTKLPILKEIPKLCVPPTDPKNLDLFELVDGQKPPLDHLLIEADNYHALKVLQYTHNNKIDVIYIDPPYNTGNKDFVYNDNYVDKEDSFRHSKWLAFMSKRLKMARELLTEKGVIFISIDDNEQAQLKLLCDQIFGESNFVANIVWRKKRGGGRGNSLIIPQTEYILIYAKDVQNLKPFTKELSEHKITAFKFEDLLGKYKREGLDHHSPKGAYERKTLQYELTIEGKEIYCPTGQWLWSKERVEKELKDIIEVIDGKNIYRNLEIVKDTQNRYRAYKKIRLNEDGEEREETLLSLIDDSKITTNSSAQEIKDIFGDVVFNYSKPVSLIKFLLKTSTQPNSTILDFMAGSGTTGQAVLELNKEDVGSRQFILVTNNELNGVGSKLVESEKLKVNSEKSGEGEEFDAEQFGICRRVTRERIKRIIEGYTNSKGNFVEGLSGNKLRYFRADFVEPIEEMEDETMLILAENSLEILKIKENCFDLVEKNRAYAIFRNSENNQILAVYWTEDRRKLEEFKQKVEAFDKQTSCYIFSYMVSKFANFFDNNAKITVKDFPEGVYKVLKVNRE
jgi:adenine-specific DNA-methyltransferase